MAIVQWACHDRASCRTSRADELLAQPSLVLLSPTEQPVDDLKFCATDLVRLQPQHPEAAEGRTLRASMDR